MQRLLRLDDLAAYLDASVVSVVGLLREHWELRLLSGDYCLGVTRALCQDNSILLCSVRCCLDGIAGSEYGRFVRRYVGTGYSEGLSSALRPVVSPITETNWAATRCLWESSAEFPLLRQDAIDFRLDSAFSQPPPCPVGQAQWKSLFH